MTSIAANLQAVTRRIERAAREAGRAPDSVHVIAVSKTWPAERIAEAHTCGQRAFGENQAQEAVEKIARLTSLALDQRVLEWHFIGPIQSNKTRLISEHFQWVHSMEREKIAARLNDARPTHLPPLDVCTRST